MEQTNEQPQEQVKVDEQPKEQKNSSPQEKPKQKIADNIIFIGGKPFIRYITGVVMQFKTKNAQEVIIKARGKFTSKAIDVAEVVKNKFLKEQNIKIKNISIASEHFQNKEGKEISTSTIDIVLVK